MIFKTNIFYTAQTPNYQIMGFEKTNDLTAF